MATLPMLRGCSARGHRSGQRGHPVAVTLEMDQQQRGGGRRNPGDPRGLPERGRAMLGQALAHFVRQSADLGVVQVLRQDRLLVAPLPLYL